MIRPRHNRPPADPYEAAAWWSARRRLGLSSPREEEAFARWLVDPEHGIAWAATEDPIEAIGACAALPELRELREAALAIRPAFPGRFWRWTALGAVAASLIFGILIWSQTSPFGTGAPQVAASTERYTTGIGERRDIRLPDGSRIELNTDSILEIAYGPGRRDVRLIGGQALFRVAHDARRPFVVAAGDRRITAVGTEFDVRIREHGAVAVTLLEGRVRVEPLASGALDREAREPAIETLDAGQRLAVTNGSVQVATADIERETSWTRGQIIFRDDRLADAVAELNRYSTMRIIVNDPRVADLRISGAFATGSVENFIAGVTAFYPLEARRESRGVTVLEWRRSGG